MIVGISSESKTGWMMDMKAAREWVLRQSTCDLIDDRFIAALARYINLGLQPGGFLTAVLANDLMRAMMRADEGGRRSLLGIVRLIYAHFPPACYGSYETVNAWVRAAQTRRAGT